MSLPLLFNIRYPSGVHILLVPSAFHHTFALTKSHRRLSLPAVETYAGKNSHLIAPNERVLRPPQLTRNQTKRTPTRNPPVWGLLNRIFETAHTVLAPQPCAPYVWEGTITVSSSVLPNICGTEHSPPLLLAPTNNSFFTAQTSLCASTGSALDAPVILTKIDTSAPAVSQPHTELRTVLAHRRLQLITPYNALFWEMEFQTHNLLAKYPHLPDSLRFGFNLNIPHIVHTQTPPNSTSLLAFHEAFETLLSRELATGRYIGPFSYDELLSAIGPFQSSPISIIPKTGKPGKYRIIQNFSFPLAPSLSYRNPSINASVNSNDFPCTWGTFKTVWTIICSLPPGSQAAT